MTQPTTPATNPEPATEAGRRLLDLLMERSGLVQTQSGITRFILAIEAAARAEALADLRQGVEARTGDFGARLGAFEDLARELVDRWGEGVMRRPESEIMDAIAALLDLPK